MPAKFLFIVACLVSASASAESDLFNDSLNDMPNEAFLEFLADLENINDVWMHPIDFKNSHMDNANMTTNKETASETNNE